MPFDEDPSAGAVYPMRGYPSTMRMRRQLPGAGHPYVRMPIPAVIAGSPNVTRSGRGTSVFDDGPWWRHSHINLCIGGSDGKKCTQNRY